MKGRGNNGAAKTEPTFASVHDMLHDMLANLFTTVGVTGAERDVTEVECVLGVTEVERDGGESTLGEDECGLGVTEVERDGGESTLDEEAGEVIRGAHFDGDGQVEVPLLAD